MLNDASTRSLPGIPRRLGRGQGRSR
jgi:hypothetical protein